MTKDCKHDRQRRCFHCWPDFPIPTKRPSDLIRERAEELHAEMMKTELSQLSESTIAIIKMDNYRTATLEYLDQQAGFPQER